MIGAVREWLAAVVAVSLLLAAAQSLIPEGAVKKIASFTGGLLLLLVLLRPLENLADRLETPDFRDFREQIQNRQAELEQAEETLLAEGIASRTAAYIWDKAAELGLSVTVRVETAAGEEGVPLPWSAEVDGPWSAELAAYMERELGIPPERQVWHEQES